MPTDELWRKACAPKPDWSYSQGSRKIRPLLDIGKDWGNHVARSLLINRCRTMEVAHGTFAAGGATFLKSTMRLPMASKKFLSHVGLRLAPSTFSVSVQSLKCVLASKIANSNCGT